MKNLKYIFILFGFISLLSSCETNEIGATDCINCQTTQTEYCYTEGYDYYIIKGIDGIEITGELIGGWEYTKQILLTQCENSDSTTDCYTCSNTNTEYCYTTNDDYYSVSVNGSTPIEENLNGSTWSDLRANFVDNCDDGSGQIDSSIVGTWITTRYVSNNETISTINGTTTSISITLNSEATSFDNYITVYSENPNEAYSSGSMITHNTINTNGTITEQDAPVTLDPTNVSQWEINGNQLVFSPIPDNVDTFDILILELTATSLKIKINVNSTTNQNGATNVSSNEIFIDYTRQ